MKKSFKAMAFILLMVLAANLNGCGAREDNSGKITVKMWVMPNSTEPLSDIKKILKDFEVANPNIKINITSVDWGAAWTKLTTAATSGDVPDLIQIGSTWVGSLSGMGALMDLSEKMPEIGGRNTFIHAAWATSGIEGSKKITSIPWFIDIRAMFYRTDVLQEAGVDPKELDSWDTFAIALKKIKDANVVINGVEIAPLGISGKNDWNVIHNISPWIWGAGGDYLSRDNNSSVISSKDSFNGVMFYVDLVDKGFVPLDYLELNTAQVSSNFNNGSCAIYFDGPYEVKTLTTPPGQGGAAGSHTSRNFAVAPYPTGPKGRYAFVGGSNLAIFSQAKHKEEAWQVIKYLISRKPQVEYSKLTGFLPARSDAFDDPYFTADPHRKVFKDSVKFGRTYPCIPAWGLLEPILTRRFGILWEYITGGKKIDAKEVQKQLDLAKIEIEGVLKQR